MGGNPEKKIIQVDTNLVESELPRSRFFYTMSRLCESAPLKNALF